MDKTLLLLLVGFAGVALYWAAKRDQNAKWWFTFGAGLLACYATGLMFFGSAVWAQSFVKPGGFWLFAAAWAGLLGYLVRRKAKTGGASAQ